MFQRTRLYLSTRSRHGITLVVSLTFAATLLSSPTLITRSPAGAQTGPIVQNDFEDGTLQGWIPRGTAVLTNTTEAAATGTHSLKTTGRTAGFHGPSLNLLTTLVRGTIYQITASVRLVGGQAADTLKITVQRTPVGGANAFDQVTPSTGVTDSAWVTLSGQYSFATDVTGLLLYIEAAGATTQYYVDDFSIRVVPALGCADPPDTSGIHSDFETGTAESWRPRIGRETLTVTTADAHGGTHSLLTTGRQAAFDGPSINAAGKLCNGSRYNVSLWAKMAPGQPTSQLRVSIQRTLGSVTNFNTVIPNTTVTANQWVRLRTTYDFAFNYNSLTLYVESASGTPSFYIDDFDLTFVPPPVAERDIPSVYQSLSEFFHVGAAVWQGDLVGEHAFLLTKHFDSLTSENDMKWSSLQPTEGNFTFATADAQVNFAKVNNMLVRGHTLVWHAQTPAWVFNDAAGNPLTPTPQNKALLLQRMETHIRTVMMHFGDDIYAWDVVNEVIDPGQPDGYRRSPWFNIIGPEYIETAFRIAREVAPKARLFINDFDTTNPTKRAFLFNLISDLRSRNVPVDGIGHQMHNNIDFPSAQAIIETVNLFWGLGLETEITELDVSIYSGSQTVIFDDYALIPQSIFIKQGYRYRTFFDAFRQLQGKINSVTFWGQADDHTWLTTAGRVNAPLLFDQSLRHKFAYLGIIDPAQLPCAISCPENITAPVDPDQCGAVVSYQTPTAEAVCGAITCNPPPGAFFPKGTTTVTCSTAVGSTCSFGVEVNDSQPPTIGCSPDLIRVAPPSCPVATSLAVTYVGPTATDNCPGVTTACVPPSGSSFPLGATTVTCTATDTSGNTTTCSFSVTVFNICLQDESNPGNRLLINTSTGQYRLLCGGTLYSGTGVVSMRGCMFTLAHNAVGRRLHANVEIPIGRGNATFVLLGTGTSCQVIDRNLANNNCNGG
jgi:endo-1,4-beta-xylanase